MEIGPDNVPDLPHEIGPAERRVSIRKLLITFGVILMAGALLLPLIFFAFDAGRLNELSYAFFALLVLGYGLNQYFKMKRK